MNLPPSTPIDPVMVPGSAIIFAAGIEIRYPPDAAYPDMLTTTGFFFAVSSTSRSISSDASIDPPGELTLRITARTSSFSRADLNASVMSSEVIAVVSGPENGSKPSPPRWISPSP